MHPREGFVYRNVADAFETRTEQRLVLWRRLFDVNAVRVLDHPETDVGKAGSKRNADAAVAIADKGRDGDQADGDLRIGERWQIVIELSEGLVKLLRRDGVVEVLVIGGHGLTHGLHIFAPLGVGEMACGSLREE